MKSNLGHKDWADLMKEKRGGTGGNVLAMQDHVGQERLIETETVQFPNMIWSSVVSSKILNITQYYFNTFYVCIPEFQENWFYMFSTWDNSKWEYLINVCQSFEILTLDYVYIV